MEDTTKPFQIFARLLDGKTATLRFLTPNADTKSIRQRIFEITKVPIQIQRLICNGKQLGENSVISTSECTVHLLLPLIGGKGGFGSLLRGAATKAGQKKTNNFDACRDMSGRRLRHVNAEKKLEEWKAEEEERRLEKIAEEFIKKSAKKGKKGVGDGEAEKYVAEYREQSALCAKEVEEAVREACGSGKRKKKMIDEGLDAKRLKIWMGKRKLAESDGEDTSDDDESEDEKSVVLNNDSHSDLNKETDRSSDSVTGEKQVGDQSGGGSCESGSEEEKDAGVLGGPNLKLSPPCEIVPDEGHRVAEPEICEGLMLQSAGVSCLEFAEISGTDAVEAAKSDNVGPDSQPVLPVLTPRGAKEVESKLLAPDCLTVAANTKENETQRPLNFEELNSAVEMEALGMERLKTELQAHGLKCGGTLQERAARLFLLKTTPVDKLPKKLLAKK